MGAGEVWRSGREVGRAAGAFWKQAPVAVLEKAEYSMLGVQRVLFWGLKPMGEHHRTALIASGHVH